MFVSFSLSVLEVEVHGEDERGELGGDGTGPE